MGKLADEMETKLHDFTDIKYRNAIGEFTFPNLLQISSDAFTAFRNNEISKGNFIYSVCRRDDNVKTRYLVNGLEILEGVTE